MILEEVSLKNYLYACSLEGSGKQIAPFYYELKSVDEEKKVLRCISLVKDIKFGVFNQIPADGDYEEVFSIADFVQRVADNTEVGYCIRGTLLSFAVALRNS